FVALGITWLYRTGAMPYYWDIVRGWLPEYNRLSTIPGWTFISFAQFFPWSVVHLLAIPLSCQRVYQAVVTPGDELQARPAIATGGLTAISYLAWLSQSTFLQHGFSYHHVPPIFLGILVVSSWEGLVPRTLLRRLNVQFVIIGFLLLHPMLR